METPLLDELFHSVGDRRTVRGGDTLLRRGAAMQSLHRLLSGRMATMDWAQDGGGRILALHRPGAVFGGAEFLTGHAAQASIVSLRDSEVISLPYSELHPLVSRDPGTLAELARVSLTSIGAQARTPAARASLLGLVAVCDSVVMWRFAEDLASAIRRLGMAVVVLGPESASLSPADLSTIEDRYDVVLMAAERSDADFTRFCGRQIDRLILVGRTDSALPENGFRFAALAIQRHRLADLILIQPADTILPKGSARWVEGAPTARLFQIRDGSGEDLARLARTFTGLSFGLALSGGGARAYAHVGVVRALREMGVAIDVVGGTSMGAVIAAGVAMDWSSAELEDRIRDAFVRSSPLADIAFPLLAMSGGRLVDRRLEEHFGDVHIADLWRPFVCASTNLSTGQVNAHRTGLLRTSLRASISLPGVLPPVVLDGQVLVDGALVRNLPTDLLRDLHDGPVIGVDVAGATGLAPEELRLRPPGLRWLTSGAWRKGPPIVSVLIRSATLPTVSDAVGGRDSVDIFIEPMLEGVQLRDWKAFDLAVERGYSAAMAQADAIAAVVGRSSGPAV